MIYWYFPSQSYGIYFRFFIRSLFVLSLMTRNTPSNINEHFFPRPKSRVMFRRFATGNDEYPWRMEVSSNLDGLFTSTYFKWRIELWTFVRNCNDFNLQDISTRIIYYQTNLIFDSLLMKMNLLISFRAVLKKLTCDGDRLRKIDIHRSRHDTIFYFLTHSYLMMMDLEE